MSSLVGPLLNALLTLTIGACIRLYPLRGKLRIKPRSVVGIYALVFLAESVVFIYLREYFPADYSGVYYSTTLWSILTMLIPIFLTRSGIFQHIFLYLVGFNYSMIVIGAGNYIERSFGGAFAAQYPYLVYSGVVILLSIPLLPLTLRGLDRLFGLLPGGRMLVWKYIWIIPALLAALCFMAGNVFMGASVYTALFIVARLFAGVGMVITCLLLARTLKQEADNARLDEHTRMMATQLDWQREQYTRLSENASTYRIERHDARHHLVTMARLNQAGETEKLGAYLNDLVGTIPVQQKVYCDNFAVNAVAAHYFTQAISEDVSVDAKLDIPEDTGCLPAMDLCVIIGNILENAVEACRRIKAGNKYIHLRSRIDGDSLVLVASNSFDGQYKMGNGVYLSRKENDGNMCAGNVPREGIGLSSVKAVCEKHRGLVEYEISDNEWKITALVHLEE